MYASQPEILAYIESVVSRFDHSSHVHLNQECTAAEWLADEFLWRVHFVERKSGRSYVKHARFLITAVGFCDVPNGTEGIRDIQNFGGRMFHSANWDQSFDFRDKNVLVVGNGCSANQVRPLSRQARVNSEHGAGHEKPALDCSKGRWPSARVAEVVSRCIFPSLDTHAEKGGKAVPLISGSTPTVEVLASCEARLGFHCDHHQHHGKDAPKGPAEAARKLHTAHRAFGVS